MAKVTKSVTEKFEGYCPTQDRWEAVAVDFIDTTTFGSAVKKYKQGLITCPYVSFRNGECNLIKCCPVIKGMWTEGNCEVFIAMQFFAPDGKPCTVHLDVIKPVCQELGLHAFIVSDIEHNNEISETILKSIAKCRFIIADLTYDNRGVYYEAGFAKGRGKEVIHTCSREWFDEHSPHFDVKGLNFVLYDGKDDFHRKLRKRIIETCKVELMQGEQQE